MRNAFAYILGVASLLLLPALAFYLFIEGGIWEDSVKHFDQVQQTSDRKAAL